ncbi:hypothetical protein KY362_00600 [Candidatus Woesearchaeota archaeon]|nr:hypothetical protein [Candidatus Woesearchaeota archaeon]
MSIEKHVERAGNYLTGQGRRALNYIALAAGAIAVSSCTLLLRPMDDERLIDDMDAGQDAAADAYDASPDGDADSDADAPYDTDVADAYDSGPDADADLDSIIEDADVLPEADVEWDADVPDAYVDADTDVDADADVDEHCIGELVVECASGSYTERFTYEPASGNIFDLAGNRIHFYEAASPAVHPIAPGEKYLWSDYSILRSGIMSYVGPTTGDLVEHVDLCTGLVQSYDRTSTALMLNGVAVSSGIDATGHLTVDQNFDGEINGARQNLCSCASGPCDQYAIPEHLLPPDCL